MEKKNKRNNHMMNKGMKQKVSVLLILCLLLTGYRGLTISGKAEQSEKKESNEISVSGTEVKVQLHGEDLRKAAKEAIEKGDKVEENFLKGYSADGELQKEYEAVFSPEKEVYEIPLDSISEGLSESLSEEEAGLQIFVERDAKDLESLVRKESKESLLLYDGNSQISKLFPEGKEEEKREKTKELTEGAIASSGETEETAVASDSNIRRNTELTGSELITFLYKNKSDHKISFKLSVDGNQYPKLAVAPKTQLFKALVEKLKQEEKKAQAEVKPAEKQEEKSIEKQEEKTKEEAVKAETSEEQKGISEETASVEEEKELSGKEGKSASEVSIVSTEGKTEEIQAEVQEPEEEKARKNEEKKEENKVETAEAETKEESAEKSEEAEKDGAKLTEVKEDSTKPAEAEKEVPETEKQSGEGKEAKEKAGVTGFLGEVLEHYEEFQGELVSARFTQYSLNELGRKSQNVEIEGFATVEVFYDDEAFIDADGKLEEVVLEAKRLVKPEETEKEGEKLSKEQVEAMKEHAIYEDSDALDIRFVSKDDRTKEIEPKAPVSVRLTFDKKAVPEEANADTIAIHHIVEDKDSGKVKYVETVLRSELEKKKEKEELKASEEVKEDDVLFAESASGELKEGGVQKEEVLSNEDEKTEHKENITKEFIVNSFSPYIVHWTTPDNRDYEIRFHYVDRNFREIAPTIYTQNYAGTTKFILYFDANQRNSNSPAYKEFPNFVLEDIGYQLGPVPYLAHPKITDWGVDAVWSNQIQITKRSTLSKPEGQRETRTLKYDESGCAHDVYFIYRLSCPKPEKKTDTDVDLLNEKFITDNLDGTYDLTLTGQVNPSQKQKLDIAFVYDNTAIMATDFNFSGKSKKLKTEHYATNPNDAKSAKVKNELKSFMEKLSANPDYDVRYALVTMDGDKSFGNINESTKWPYNPSYISGKDYQNTIFMKGKPADSDINLVGEYIGTSGNVFQWLDNSTDYGATSYQFNVIDTPFNDTKHLYGFTDKPTQIVDQLKALDERAITSNRVSGENYESAIRNLKVLLGQGGDYQVASGGLDNQDSKARSDAQKIVVFIAGGNPKLSYIVKDGVYEDTHRYADNADYKIRRDYKEGYSFGNGYSVDFSALNRARGELRGLTAADAFYSIGVGNEENWKSLNDFAMGQCYNEEGKHRPEEGYDEEKHPDRREKALVDNIRYKCFDASSESGLVSALQQIYNREAGSRAKNIVIRDVLTKNVQPFMKDGKPVVSGQLVKMKSNGNKQAVEVEKVFEADDIDDMKKLGLDGFKIEAKEVYSNETGISGLNYDGKRWLLTLKTDPEDFALPAGYDIRMVAKVEPTEEAKKLFESDLGYKDKGDKRTDLNDIYQTDLHRKYHEDGKPDSMFNSSADKYGLFTNEYADITYKTKKPDGSEGSPQTKKYKKPIISKGSLIIEKTFSGLEGTKLFDDSSGKITDFGKKVLKQLKFIVQAEKFKGLNSFGQETSEFTPLLELNLQADSWWTEPANFKNGVTSDVTGTDNLQHKVTLKIVQESGKAPQLKITVDNLIPSKRYMVYEYCNKPEGAVEKIELSGSAYQLKGVSVNENPIIFISGSKSLDSSEPCKPDNVFKITNCYEKKDNPKTITVKKVVTGMAKPTASSTEKFQFHLVIKKHDGGTGQSLSDTEKKSIISDLKAKYPKSSGFNIRGNSINLTSPKEINEYTISFELKDGDSIQIPLKPNYLFQVYEKKSEGYKKAEIVSDWKGSSRKITAETGQDDHQNEFTYMEALEEPYDGEIITFQNPAKFTIPTGLTRDTTPYLLSIFGFVAMAGVYLTIKKKKRIEI